MKAVKGKKERWDPAASRELGESGNPRKVLRRTQSSEIAGSEIKPMEGKKLREEGEIDGIIKKTNRLRMGKSLYPPFEKKKKEELWDIGLNAPQARRALGRNIRKRKNQPEQETEDTGERHHGIVLLEREWISLAGRLGAPYAGLGSAAGPKGSKSETSSHRWDNTYSEEGKTGNRGRKMVWIRAP